MFLFTTINQTSKLAIAIAKSGTNSKAEMTPKRKRNWEDDLTQVSTSKKPRQKTHSEKVHTHSQNDSEKASICSTKQSLEDMKIESSNSKSKKGAKNLIMFFENIGHHHKQSQSSAEEENENLPINLFDIQPTQFKLNFTKVTHPTQPKTKLSLKTENDHNLKNHSTLTKKKLPPKSRRTKTETLQDGLRKITTYFEPT